MPRSERTSGRDRPLIGIAAHTGPVSFAIFDKVPATFMFHKVVERVAAAGGQPVLLPPLPGVDDVVDRLDGLVLAGGPDVDPARYTADLHPRTVGVDADRDAADLALAEAALRAELPMLGVCRGVQVVNVLLDGSLHQHLPEVVGHSGHAPGPGAFGAQPVSLQPGSRVADIFGADRTVATCLHHQAIDRLGRGVVASGWSADGTVEAIEIEGHPFAVGLQWHAEEADDPAPFVALVAAARRAEPAMDR